MDRSKPYPGFWHAALLCAIFIGTQSVLTTPVFVLDLALKSSFVTHPLVLAAVSLGAWALAMLVAWAIGRRPLHETAALKLVPARLYLPILCGGLGAIILLSEADNLLRTVLPPPKWLLEIFREMSPSSGHPLAGFFLLVIVAPVTEEYLFRGVILRGFLLRFRLGAALIVSALLFGAVHMNPWQFLSASGLGVLLAWWYARTQSLIPCLIGHMLTNGTVYMAELLPFEITGFNAGDPFTTSGVQPWWFDATGVALFVFGIWLFHRLAPPLPPCPESVKVELPPVIAN
jgi:membrane protease YdiL (CAAX protease family)